MASESNMTTLSSTSIPIITQTPSKTNPLFPSASITKTLSILFFGTNQYYETPQELVRKFTSTKEVDNFSNPKEHKIFFDYKICLQEKATSVKFIFLNILDQEYTICKKADAYVIFIDLESIDSLDKLSNIITYIKETCRSIITTHIFGKYEKTEDKIKSLSYDNMNEYLKDKNIGYNYQEICTGDDTEVIEGIKTMLQLASDSQARIIKNSITETKKVVKLKTSDQDISNSICIVV